MSHPNVTLAACERALDEPATAWASRCHEIAGRILQAGLVQGRLAYGGNNILDGGRMRRLTSSGQAGFATLGLVFALALVSSLGVWLLAANVYGGYSAGQSQRVDPCKSDRYVSSMVKITRHEQRHSKRALASPVVVPVTERSGSRAVLDGASNPEVPLLQFGDVGREHEAGAEIVVAVPVSWNQDDVWLCAPRSAVLRMHGHADSDVFSQNWTGIYESYKKDWLPGRLKIDRADSINVDAGTIRRQDLLFKQSQLTLVGYRRSPSGHVSEPSTKSSQRSQSESKDVDPSLELRLRALFGFSLLALGLWLAYYCDRTFNDHLGWRGVLLWLCALSSVVASFVLLLFRASLKDLL